MNARSDGVHCNVVRWERKESVWLVQCWSRGRLGGRLPWSSWGEVWLGVEPKTPIVPRRGSNVGQEATGPVAKQEKKQTTPRDTHRLAGVSKRGEKVGGGVKGDGTSLGASAVTANSGVLGVVLWMLVLSACMFLWCWRFLRSIWWLVLFYRFAIANAPCVLFQSTERTHVEHGVEKRGHLCHNLSSFVRQFFRGSSVEFPRSHLFR